MKSRACEKLRRDCGELLLSALNDPATIEVMLNPDGSLWLERLGQKMTEIGSVEAHRAESILRGVAGYHGKIVTQDQAILECEWPLDGSRFAGQIPPLVSKPSFAIRKKAVSIFTLDQYVANGVMNDAQRTIIIDAVKRHRNILVIGGTGSGKTTLVNAIINEMVATDPEERLVIIEDTGEIQCAARNSVLFHTSATANMTALLRTTLRMRPDRILVGEVRGPEALDLLMAWNTGHEGGAATLHANNAEAGLSRLQMLISMHADAPHPIEPLIAEAVHLIVHIARTPEQGRRIQSILEVQGFAGGAYQFRSL
nr:P-type conjugative transfer ATPase TrbB [Novosphingobium terrae]